MVGTATGIRTTEILYRGPCSPDLNDGVPIFADFLLDFYVDWLHDLVRHYGKFTRPETRNPTAAVQSE